MSKLLEISSQSGLLGGIFPSVNAEAGPVWQLAKNVLFREAEMMLAKGDTVLSSAISRAPGRIVQAYANGERRAYYEDAGAIFYYNGTSSVLVGTLDSAGIYDLETFGTWLLATDNITPPKLWKNTGTFADVNAALPKARLIKKLQQHIIYYATEDYPLGFQWSSRDDPEDIIPLSDNTAGDLTIREINSEIVAVVPLSGGHGVYSRESLFLVYWVGGDNVLGYRHLLDGVGAVSAGSVVSYGEKHAGVFQGGIFITDGAQLQIVDRPAITDYIFDEVDWDRESEISGYFNELTGLIEWSLPIIAGGGRETLGMDPNRLTFTKFSREGRAGIERQVFRYPLVGTSAGLLAASIGSYVSSAQTMQLRTKPLAAGDNRVYKTWNSIVFDGKLGNGLQVRFGYSDDPEAVPEWTDWQTVVKQNDFEPRESLYLTIDFNMDSEASDLFWKMSAMYILGEPGGAYSL